MQKIRIQQEWFDRLLPEGLPIPSSTIISGPGGTGKPLIGNMITATWLRQGGSVIFMSLQYPDPSFIIESMQSVANLNLNDYMAQTAFIELDATLEGLEKPTGNKFKANIVKPAVWDAGIAQATAMVTNKGPGILIFGSAINLLLFSPTFGNAILEKIITTVKEEKHYTYLFATSTTAKAEEVAKLEGVMDNLIMTRSTTSPFRLYMQIKRIKGATFLTEEIGVPIPEHVLTEIKESADYSRKRVIPLISKL